MFYEIHRDGVPWFDWDRQLFEFTIWLVVLCLGTCAVCTGVDVRFHHSSQAGPVEIPFDEVNGFHLPKVACHRVIMMITDNLEVKVLMVRDVESLFIISLSACWFQPTGGVVLLSFLMIFCAKVSSIMEEMESKMVVRSRILV